MSEQIQIRVFSVDDHPLLRQGIAAIINSQPDMLLVAQAATGIEAIQQFREHRPDVALKATLKSSARLRRARVAICSRARPQRTWSKQSVRRTLEKGASPLK
jgi:chemotaxis response regulator CheB